MSPVEPESDLTRKQRREQAREQRKAIEEAEAGQAARRKRLIQLGSVAGVVVVIIAVILVATGSGGSKSAVAPKSAAANATMAEVTSLLDGIPQNGNTLGDPNAPVTLQYFGDLECPICREFTVESLPSIIPKLVRTGKLKIEYRSMSTATGDAEKEGAEPQEIFKTQQTAAYAAGKQDKAWDFIEAFYHEQGEEDSGYVTEKFIQGIAEQVPGLDLRQWTSDRNDADLANEVAADAQAANTAGFTGTPSFLIGKTGGSMNQLSYPSSPGEPAFVEEAVEKLLKT
jgi:protein-disulfide isomerase